MANSFDGEVVYIVADGEKAKFLHHKGGSFSKVEALDAHKRHESGTPGITPTGATPGDRSKDAFARVVADHMNAVAAHDTSFEGFVLAAPGTILHDIKGHLSKLAEKKLIKTLVKDLTNIPEHDLLSHFDIPETGWKTA